MSGKVFVDTNVLVYARDSSEFQKQEHALLWMRHLWGARTGMLSFQVLHEFYVTVTDKLRPGLDTGSARNDVRLLMSWKPIPMDERVIEGAWRVQDQYQFSWWDAMIVSAAQCGGCRYLLSEDFSEAQDLGSVYVVNPFKTEPSSLES